MEASKEVKNPQFNSESVMPLHTRVVVAVDVVLLVAVAVVAVVSTQALQSTGHVVCWIARWHTCPEEGGHKTGLSSTPLHFPRVVELLEVVVDVAVAGDIDGD